MTSPTGRELTLRADGYEAEVVEVGAGLRALRRDGVDVIAGYPPGQMCSGGRGQHLIPWPNRVEDGVYEFDGRRLQLPLSEPAKSNASHGLLRWANWTLAESSDARALWSCRLHPQPGYPFLLDVTVEYVLDADGLRVTQSARNLGPDPAPYGAGAHPYLTVGARLDQCELLLPATTRLEIDARGLPTDERPTVGSDADFSTARLIGDTVLDHPYGGLQRVDGLARAVLRDPRTGREAAVTVDDGYRWLQAFSGDTLSSGAREALAVEPMTCPPNAFRTGVDLVRLEPGDRHQATFVIS